MLLAKTLVHKAAMPIALHAVRTFAAVADKAFRLDLHSDGSLEEQDWVALERAVDGRLPLRRVDLPEVHAVIAGTLGALPLARELFSRGGYMTKMAVLASEDGPFFYFDSDIVWLRSFALPESLNSRTVFSTETWSWYYAMAKPREWIRDRVPRRINSGFALMPGRFPFERLEALLRRGFFNPSHPWATDQEFLACLYPDCRVFSLRDFARTRRGIHYELSEMSAIALHFPGRMWKDHMDAIPAFEPLSENAARQPGIGGSVPMDWPEVLRMKATEWIETNPFLAQVANAARRLRAQRKLRG
jgi:hypothetical protein